MKKKFRVAVEGKTIDNRELPKEVLASIVKNFDPKFNTARVNCEHLAGYSPNPPFNAYGTITGLSLGTEDFTVGGKKETLTCLYAEIDANDQLVEVTNAGQKIFTSIEFWPNFRGQPNEFCLGGLAITDTPASFGTEPLKFTITDIPVEAKQKSSFCEFTQIAEKEPEKAAESFFAALVTKLENFGAKKEPEPKSEQKQSENQDFSVLIDTMKTGFEGFSKSLAELKNASQVANNNAVNALNQVAELKGKLETTHPASFTPRTTSTGASAEKAYY